MRSLLPALLLAALACHPGGSALAARGPVLVSAKSGEPVTCAALVARAKRQPDLPVDRVPEPVAYRPQPIRRPVPPGVVGRDGRAEVRIQVLVDTLGRPDMRTFRVVKTTHPWLAESVRDAVRQWTFTPAQIQGCKVPRVYKFGATSGPRPRS